STAVVCIGFFYMVAATSSARDEFDTTAKTMEEFSGYSIHEPSCLDSSFSSIPVDTESLQKEIEELSMFSDTPTPSVTRILYSENDVLARRYIKYLMGRADLSVREDAVGNIFGRWVGSEPELSPVATGSHIDAIPYSGKYDGVVGVIGAIEAINVLKRFGFKPKRSLEVIMFTSEEPTRFGISCLGSRLLAGSKELARVLATVVDGQNISFADAAKSVGYLKNDDISQVFLEKGSYFSFIELHIEQGPILEEEGTQIGIVTAIAAPASLKVDFEGNGGHAGAVLMRNRNDAGLAAAELSLAVEKHVLQSGSGDTVGTVGILELHPGAINSIPLKAHLEIDVRDIDENRRNAVMDRITDSARSISSDRGVKLTEFRIVNQDPPASCADPVVNAIESSCRELKFSYRKMISRAYHDSLFMDRISDMGMIFIPCHKGYSHKPEEFADPDDIANGVRVLASALAKLSLS
ncbi:hypothetical protein M569_11390, partial [Genlisea aurea]